MSNSLNTYTLLLKNCYTKKVNVYTLHNISTNELFYEFNFQPTDLPTGEYEYYLVWNTLDNEQAQLTISNEILDSYFTTNNGKVYLRDTLPDTGILKVIDNNQSTTIELDNNKNYISL